MADEPNFDIGLVMAGAISAGAYTAGALDFLIEALETWQAAKDRGEDVPSHGARITAMAGASAGGICGAIAAVALGHAFTHVSHRNLGRATNPLFQSWVTSIDIAPLLEVGDLANDAPLFSLLNTSRLDEIVAGVLATTGAPIARPYIAQDLAVRLAVGNLRGVPYAFGLKGNTGAGHAMVLHGDDASFVVAERRPADLRPGWSWLKRPNDASDDAWRAFGTAALATGAFPLFLRARGLARSNHAALDHRRFVLPGDGTSDPMTGPSKVVEILAAWPAPAPDPSQPYKFLCVDGGVIDNEPLGLAHEVLAGGLLNRNPRAGETATRALVMIDPFVEDTTLGPAELAPVLKLVAPLLSAWKMQCRFKPADLALAHAPGVYSRFLLAPSRGADHPAGAHPCASGGLAGFLGFFHERFRAHDYLLGRRNCQRFLAHHFTLPKTNPLFAAWIGKSWAGAWEIAEPEGPHAPIIPLVGALKAEEPLPAWPAGAFDPEDMEDAVETRVEAILDAAIADLSWVVRRYIGIGRFFGGESAVVDAVMDALKGALAAQRLERP
ncbi:MAG: patatin-like phospholipase family protein [Alphaproteobacteria bacterium]